MINYTIHFHDGTEIADKVAFTDEDVEKFEAFLEEQNVFERADWVIASTSDFSNVFSWSCIDGAEMLVEDSVCQIF